MVKKLVALEKRFASCPIKKRKDEWLFPQIGSMAHWKAEAPDDLPARKKTKWAKERRKHKVEALLETINTRLIPSAKLSSDFKEGELSFSIDGVPVIEIFMNEGDGKHISAYWQHLARTITITEKFKASTLIGKLMATPMTDNADLAAQISILTAEVDALHADIAAHENELDEIIFGLYGLTAEERTMVQGG